MTPNYSNNGIHVPQYLSRDYGVPSLSDRSELSSSTAPHMMLNGTKRVTLKSIQLDVIDNAVQQLEHQKTLNEIKYHEDHPEDQPCDTCYNLSELYYDTCSHRWRKLIRRNDIVLVNKIGDNRVTRFGSFYRDKFEEKLRLFGFTIQKVVLDEMMFTVIGGHFERLGKCGEAVGLCRTLESQLQSVVIDMVRTKNTRRVQVYLRGVFS